MPISRYLKRQTQSIIYLTEFLFGYIIHSVSVEFEVKPMEQEQKKVTEQSEENSGQSESAAVSDGRDAKRKEKKGFAQRCKDLWHYFTLYEKIWFFSILVVAIVLAFVVPETDEPNYTVQLKNSYDVTASGNFNIVSFDGTEDCYVIQSVTVTRVDADGEKTVKYEMAQLMNVGEWYVDPSDESTMSFTLGLFDKASKATKPFDYELNKDCDISFECYYNGEEDEPTPLVISLVSDGGDKLVDRAEFTLDEDQANVIVNKFLVSAAFITFLYVMDVILNIACELLISKQSKWNFIVSLGVEIVEIVTCVVCLYRFATMAVTLLFWIPCDIISFVMWHRHPDKQQEELTVVKKLTWWQDIILIAAIAVWTVGVGYLLTLIEIPGGIFATNRSLENIVCYLDAAASAVGIANGLLILFRYREQWIAWYIVAILETVIDIMAGQWILLVLKVGYLTNTTYGYIKWTQYIRRHKGGDKEERQPQIA